MCDGKRGLRTVSGRRRTGLVQTDDGAVEHMSHRTAPNTLEAVRREKAVALDLREAPAEEAPAVFVGLTLGTDRLQYGFRARLEPDHDLAKARDLLQELENERRMAAAPGQDAPDPPPSSSTILSTQRTSPPPLMTRKKSP